MSKKKSDPLNEEVDILVKLENHPGSSMWFRNKLFTKEGYHKVKATKRELKEYHSHNFLDVIEFDPDESYEFEIIEKTREAKGNWEDAPTLANSLLKSDDPDYPQDEEEEVEEEPEAVEDDLVSDIMKNQPT